MSNEPFLLFLHGVGDGDPNDRWKDQLTQALVGAGYPELDSSHVIVPKYARALKGIDETVPLPKLTIKDPAKDEARQNRRDFERRMAAIEYRLGRHNPGSRLFQADTVVDMATRLPSFVAVQNYVNDPEIRAKVLDRILRKVPSTGRIVLVGHSLGSVIAADLIRRLPVGLEVSGFVTIGSPLANGNFNVEGLQESLRQPPTNVKWWANFWNVLDPVAAHRGVSSVFPWMVDFRIQTGTNIHVHDATEYLSNALVAEAIGFAMFGSTSTELVLSEKGLEIPLTETERITLLALRYAHLIKMRLAGDIRDRYTGALRQVQATAIRDLWLHAIQEGRPVSSEIVGLAFDYSDPLSVLPEPRASQHFTKDEAASVLTTLAAENNVRPFEIVIPKDKKDKVDKREDAMRDLSAEMGLGGQFGNDVFASGALAQDALRDRRGVNWVKWSALGAGAAALVVATGGLALAAGAGLAGAAVVTSALASFGPGGMIGGLLTAGTLATAGGGGLAIGLASSSTSAETVEAVVERQLSIAILRKRQNLDLNPVIWQSMKDAEMAVRREHERLDEFSDEKAPSIIELKRKISAVERALAYMRSNGLEPEIEIIG